MPEPVTTDDFSTVEELAWSVYQACLAAYMQRISEPLRWGESHCGGAKYVYLPRNFEVALDIAIAAFKPGAPTMRGGHNIFGHSIIVFDADQFEFED